MQGKNGKCNPAELGLYGVAKFSFNSVDFEKIAVTSTHSPRKNWPTTQHKHAEMAATHGPLQCAQFTFENIPGIGTPSLCRRLHPHLFAYISLHMHLNMGFDVDRAVPKKLSCRNGFPENINFANWIRSRGEFLSFNMCEVLIDPMQKLGNLIFFQCKLIP